MAILLSLVASIAFGSGDFLGGSATRRLRATTTTLLAHLAGLLCLLPVVLLVPGRFSLLALLWGAAAGLVAAPGLVLFFRGLSSGRMTAVSPLAGVLTAAVPVAAGALLGQHPGAAATAGIGLGLIAIVLLSISRSGPADGGTLPALGLGAAAGVTFGLFFVFVSRAPASTGLWPLLGARLASCVFFVALTIARGGPGPVPRPPAVRAAVAGVLDTFANALFLIAVRMGDLGVVAVLASLYPAVTVLLAMMLEGERPRWWQLVGLGTSLVAVALIALPISSTGPGPW